MYEYSSYNNNTLVRLYDLYDNNDYYNNKNTIIIQ